MAVDFGTKRWNTTRDETYLRLAKLMITRKILFAGPLATLLLVPKRVETNNKLQEYLTESFEKPPLAQIASVSGLLEDKSRKELGNLLVNYERFMQILDSKDREVLKDPDKDRKQFTMVWEEVIKLADAVQNSLEVIFCDDELFRDNYRRYGVF